MTASLISPLFGGIRRLRASAESLRQESQQLPDLESVHARILKSWKVQRRGESKERIEEALDKFIKELRKAHKVVL